MLFRLLAFVLILNTSIVVSSGDVLPAITQENIDQITEVLVTERDGSVIQVHWNPAGDRFAVVRHHADDEVVEIWNLQESPLSINQTLVIHPELVSEVHWLSDGKSIVTHGSRYIGEAAHFYVQVWNAETGNQQNVLLDSVIERPVIAEFDGQKRYGAVVPPILAWNSDYTNSAIADGLLSFQLSGGTRFSAGNDEYRWIHQVLWSPDDQFIAVVYGSGDTYQIQLLDAETLSILTLAYGEDYVVSEMAWSPDNSSIVVAGIWANPFTPSVNVRFYDVGEVPIYGGETVLSADIPEVSRHRSAAFAWHPDSTIIGISFPETLEFYETDAFTELVQINIVEVTTLDWHPSGKLFVSGDATGTIRLWGVPSDS